MIRCVLFSISEWKSVISSLLVQNGFAPHEPPKKKTGNAFQTANVFPNPATTCAMDEGTKVQTAVMWTSAFYRGVDVSAFLGGLCRMISFYCFLGFESRGGGDLSDFQATLWIWTFFLGANIFTPQLCSWFLLLHDVTMCPSTFHKMDLPRQPLGHIFTNASETISFIHNIHSFKMSHHFISALYPRDSHQQYDLPRSSFKLIKLEG